MWYKQVNLNKSIKIKTTLLTHNKVLIIMLIQGGISMKDFSAYTVNDKVFFSGAEKKEEIIIDGFRYSVSSSA